MAPHSFSLLNHRIALSSRLFRIFTIPALSIWLYLFPASALSQTIIPYFKDSVDQKSTLTAEEEGQLLKRMVKIDKIFIKGNKKTKEYVIRRELSLQEGEMVALDELEAILKKDRQRISNTRLFLKVETTAIPLTERQYDILIEVSERWYIVPVPIFRLADRNFNDWWVNQERDFSRVNVGLKFTHYNFRGRREKLALMAQFGYTRSLQAQYYIPYIDQTRKNGLGITLLYAANANIPLHTRNHMRIFIDSEDHLREVYAASVYFTRRASFYNTHTAQLSFNSSHIADTVLSLNPDYLLTGKNTMRYFSLGYSFRRDMRDVNSYPLRGFYIGADAYKRGLGIYNDLNMFYAEVDYNHYTPLAPNIFFSNSFTGRLSTPQRQPYSLLTGLGYGGSYIRGYELYVIEGQHYILNKSELKYRVLKEEISLGNLMPFEQFRHVPFAVYPKVYFDAGYVVMPLSYPHNELLTNKPIYGGGIGLDVVSFYDFVFRMEYSFNSIGQRGLFLHFSSGI